MKQWIQKIGYLGIAVVLFTMAALAAPSVEAQSCSGSITCEFDCISVKFPEGCIDTCDPADPYGCIACEGDRESCDRYTTSCSWGVYGGGIASCPVGGTSCCGATCYGSGGRFGGESCTASTSTPTPPACTVATSWTAWGPCSKTCGSGTRSRYNTCSKQTEYELCNTHNCPINCQDNPDAFWGEWGPCSTSCGTGEKSRTNTCTNATETESCTSSNNCCTWGEWGECVAPCEGTGTQYRTDSCNNYESRACTSTQSCSCQNKSWTGWTQCSSSCNGVQTRDEVCVDTGDILQSQQQACNVNAGGCMTGSITNTIQAADCSSLTIGDQTGSVISLTAYPTGSERTYHIPNYSFEEGHANQWIYIHNLSPISVINYLTTPGFTKPDGNWFLALRRDPLDHADPHFTTDWFESGITNLSGKTLRLRFKATSELINNQIYRIDVQSRPVNDDWSNGTSVTAELDPVTVIPNVWQDYEYTVTFPQADAGYTGSQMRIVLRTPYNDYAVYYDAIALSAIGVVDTVKFYYATEQITPTPDYCAAELWTEIPGAVYTPQNGNDAWTVNWDTAGLVNGTAYQVAVNVADNMGTSCTANPSGVCSGSGFTARCSSCGARLSPCQLSCNSCSVAGTDNSCGGQCPQGADYGQPSGTLTITSPTDGAVVRPTTLDGVIYEYPIEIAYADPDAITKADYIEFIVYNQYYFGEDDMLRSNSQGIFDTLGANTDPQAYYERISLSGQVTQEEFMRIITAKKEQGRQVKIAARAVNTSCDTEAVSDWTITQYTLTGEVMGQILENPSGQCVAAGATPVSLSSGLVGVYGAGANLLDAANILNSSTYLLDEALFTPTDAWGQHNGPQSARLVITNDDLNNAYVCSTCSDVSLPVQQSNSCAADFSSCTCTMTRPLYGLTTEYVSPVDSPYDFYVERYNLAANPWWQTWSGLVYARDNLTSLSPTAAAIADSCILDGQCDPNLIQTLAGPNGNPSPTQGNSAGVPIAATGNVTAGDNTGGFYTNRSDNPRVTGNVTQSAIQENYSYFAKTTDVIIPPKQVSGTTVDIDALSDLAAQTTASGDTVYTTADSLTITIDSASKWSITGGSKTVVYVAGDLTINATGSLDNANQAGWIDVAEGSFLGFIVGGNITFDSDIGYTGDSSLDVYQTPNIEGVYIADGTITVASAGGANPSDRKFVGAGTFVGWTGISLPRDFSDGAYRRELNATTPTDTFIYRPDFLINTPVVLQRSQYTWQEVN